MFNIPPEKLPASLKDEERLNVLFGPLRSQSVNSKDWEDKISAWKNIIKVYCDTNDVYCFSLSSLRDAFIRHGRPPHCLNEVIQDMIKSKEVEAFEVFIKRGASWSSWATDILIKRPLNWSYNKVKNVIFTSQNEAEYVHVEVIRKKSEELILSVPSSFKNRVISLKELIGITNSKEKNITLLVYYLMLQQKVAIANNINILNTNELGTVLLKISNDKKPPTITELDLGIYKLEQNEQLISRQIEEMEDEIQNCVQNAKKHLTQKHREMAKSCLVKKHTIEKRLLKKISAWHNLQNLLEQMKDTHTNTEVWDAYNTALNAFNSTLTETGMSTDSVDDTMIKLGEVLDTHDVIQQALSGPVRDESTSDLEKELEELLREEIVENNEDPPPNDDSSDSLETRLERLRLNLPEVPDNTPDSSVQECL